jgi:hypothetical protein
VRDQDDALVDLATATIVTEVRDRKSGRMMLRAATGSGITIESVGVFSHMFTDQQMRTLKASEGYEVGCTIQLNAIVQQFYIGTLPVLDGVVE